MFDRQILIKEIEMLPNDFIDDIYNYVTFLKHFKCKTQLNAVTLASEHSLAKEWLSPEEDRAWADL